MYISISDTVTKICSVEFTIDFIIKNTDRDIYCFSSKDKSIIDEYTKTYPHEFINFEKKITKSIEKRCRKFCTFFI